MAAARLRVARRSFLAAVAAAQHVTRACAFHSPLQAHPTVHPPPGPPRTPSRSLFWQIAPTPQNVRVYYGAFFMVNLFMVMSSMPILAIILDTKAVWFKHRDNLFLPAWAHGVVRTPAPSRLPVEAPRLGAGLGDMAEGCLVPQAKVGDLQAKVTNLQARPTRGVREHS
jgi:hypothetical protein